MSNPLMRLDPTSVPGHPSLEETAAFAAQLHAGQTDLAGEPYFGHLVRVSRNLSKLFRGATSVERHAAWLHDALEDTDLTIADLRGRGYAPEVIAIVQAVTKNPDGHETYAERIEALAQAGPRGAIKLKIADLTDNLDPVRLSALPADRAAALGKRYRRARDRLLAALDVPIGGLSEEDDLHDAPMTLALRLPAVDLWAIGEAARLADRDLQSFAVEELTGLAHRIVAQGGVGGVELERDRLSRDGDAQDDENTRASRGPTWHEL